ncbi:TetR/AcrR family transcriptional regulator [Nocardia fluminea]|uniref:TetR/AcrR family transcriptional regulator n=1 Tax=Nocardia fluminea TaxID=134984 RepID=UPI0036702F4C
MPHRADQPRKRPQQTRAKETRARILDAAAQLFGDRGIANTSTNRIAAEACMSIGTLYRYFPDREEIVKELAMVLLDRLCKVFAGGDVARAVRDAR